MINGKINKSSVRGEPFGKLRRALSNHKRETPIQRILKYIFSQEVIYESYKELRIAVVGRMAYCHWSNPSVQYQLLRDRYTNGMRSDCSWRIAYRRPVTTVTCTWR